jgi:hypothetical protein
VIALDDLVIVARLCPGIEYRFHGCHLRVSAASSHAIAINCTVRLITRFVSERSALPAVAWEPVYPPDRRAVGRGVRLHHCVTPSTEPGAVPRQALTNHHLADVLTREIANPDAAIARPVAVQLAPQGAALNQLEHSPCGLGTTRFVTFGRGPPIEADRHTADHDRVAISNVGDLAGQGAASAISGRSGPGEHQDRDEQAQEAAVHDLLITNVQVEDAESSYTGTTAMAIVPLPLPTADEARALLHHLLEHGDIVGRDTAGRTVIQPAVNDWVLEKLMTFNAEAADLEDGGDDEPDTDDEEDGPPVLSLSLWPRRPVRWHDFRVGALCPNHSEGQVVQECSRAPASPFGFQYGT